MNMINMMLNQCRSCIFGVDTLWCPPWRPSMCTTLGCYIFSFLFRIIHAIMCPNLGILRFFPAKMAWNTSLVQDFSTYSLHQCYSLPRWPRGLWEEIQRTCSVDGDGKPAAAQTFRWIQLVPFAPCRFMAATYVWHGFPRCAWWNVFNTTAISKSGHLWCIHSRIGHGNADGSPEVFVPSTRRRWTEEKVFWVDVRLSRWLIFFPVGHGFHSGTPEAPELCCGVERFKQNATGKLRGGPRRQGTDQLVLWKRQRLGATGQTDGCPPESIVRPVLSPRPRTGPPRQVEYQHQCAVRLSHFILIENYIYIYTPLTSMSILVR